MKHKIIYLLFPAFLSACTADTQEFWDDLGKTFEPNKPRQAVNVTKGYPEPKGNYTHTTKKTKTQQIAHGRINTTACNDLDDWYLDGFRVGKSFRSQRNSMFQQRVAYCKGSGPIGYQKNWERGFQVGIKS